MAEMKGFAHRVAAYIEEKRIFGKQDRLLVALSGGADSVALLRVLLALGYDCVAVHCNFHLRGEESMRDERFAVDLCHGLGIRCETTDFDVPEYEQKYGVSTEMACRELRYGWFEEMRKKHGCEAIAVAHHRDDNAETFFLNLMRGTGLAGLAGMKPRNGRIVRPLLCVGKSDIETYLACLQQPYMTDSTNKENLYRRNKIRNVLLPALRSCFPEADNAIAMTIGNLEGDLQLFRTAVSQEERRISHNSGGVLEIDKRKLAEAAAPETLLHEMLSRYGYNTVQTKDMWQSIQRGQSGAVFETPATLAEVGRERIFVFPKLEEEQEYVFRLPDVAELPVRFAVQEMPNSPSFRFSGNKYIAYFDSTVLQETLTLRHWRTGDRFRPFGMKGTKKLSDYFNDCKLSLWERKTAWLLCAGEQILWIVGHRASSCFAVTDRTESVVVIKYVVP